MNNLHANEDSRDTKNDFICGVIEGFYGRPWSFEQRRDLFKRLKNLKLNSFMYAPKDDTKHRAKWRQPYSEPELSQLATLISEAKCNGIDFYYSLAPGLDMVYSDREEIQALLKKYDQLVQIGCESFAILFDDIEPSINDRDQAVFRNYSAAQVSVTNVVFEHLNRPKFLFCPTEYCESRAVPDVTNSCYLNTLGTGLLDGIDIMWSGSRVISKTITEESIETLTKVIRRPPVIWENLHANDYDKKRVFLGPYSGRSTKIIPKLRGVLTNPNCEYEANYIAIHTLAQWSRCTEDLNRHNQCNPARSIPDRRIQRPASVYDPDRALVEAINSWLPLVRERRSLPSGINLSKLRDDEVANCQLSKEQETSIEVADQSNVVMMDESVASSLDSINKSDIDMSDSPIPVINPTETNSCDSCDMQDTNSEQAKIVNLAKPQEDSFSKEHNQIESKKSKITKIEFSNNTLSDQLNFNSISLLVDLFYLPFEHGLYGCALLKDIQWLKDNSDIIILENSKSSSSAPISKQQEETLQPPMNIDSVDESKLQETTTNSESSERTVGNWLDRAEKLNYLCGSIDRLVTALIHDCPNKFISMELYPYLAEMRDVISMITDYVKFLRYRSSELDCFYHTTCLKHNKHAEACSNDDQEPWVHRGGLIGDVQRLLS